MAENTKIEWCDHTFNPWIGCTKVSTGCENCYAERDFGQRKHFAEWGSGKPRRRTSEANWKKPLAWNRKAEKENRRFNVFCGSLCDVFDEEVPERWRCDLFRLVRETKNLNWLFLTKRPEIMTTYFIWGYDKPLPNLWLGVSVCNQKEVKKVWTLLETPAVGRFVSVEPMLGKINFRWKDHFLSQQLRQSLITRGFRNELDVLKMLDWIICGGETGPNARPLHPDWVRSLRDQCEAAEVPYFFKQWGEWSPLAPLKNGTFDLDSAMAVAEDGTVYDPLDIAFPDGKRRGEAYDKSNFHSMYRVGKAAAGCEIDGKEWKQVPEKLKTRKE